MIKKVAQEIANEGGRVFYVGGLVRDQLLGISAPGQDIDVEIFGLPRTRVRQLLARFGKVQEFGQSFTVIRIKELTGYDFVLPAEASLDPGEACKRRDFTINAILCDVLSGEIVDPLGGGNDLRNRTIRVCSSQSLQDDPLRAYRAAQLAARLGFSIDPPTLNLMAGVDLKTVSKERILPELLKLLLLARTPSRGLSYLQSAGLLEQVHPLLAALVGCPQDPLNHPEGDVWSHTLLVVDQAARLKNDSKNPAALMLAALLHDLGKALVTREIRGRLTAYQHDTCGEGLARSFLEDIKAGKRLVHLVANLVREHMRPTLLYKQRDQVGDRAIRKLACRVDTAELLLLSRADYQGRATEKDFHPIHTWLTERLNQVGLEPGERPRPLIRGRDLVARGYRPGLEYKTLLDYAFGLQLEGLDKSQILTRLEQRSREKMFESGK